MLPDKLWRRTLYLSSHFDDKRCRDELHKLIEDYISEENKDNKRWKH